MAELNHTTREELRDDIREEIKPIGDKVDKLMLRVLGNGTPEASLLWRVEKIERFISIAARVHWIVLAAFLLSVVTGAGAAVVWLIRAMGV